MNREYVQVSDRIILRTDKGLKTLRNYDNLDDILVFENKIERTKNEIDIISNKKEMSELEKKTLEKMQIYLRALVSTGAFAIVAGVTNYREGFEYVIIPSAIAFAGTMAAFYMKNDSTRINDDELKINKYQNELEDKKQELAAQKMVLEQLKNSRVEDNTIIENERYVNLEQFEKENMDKYDNILKLQLKKEN